MGLHAGHEMLAKASHDEVAQLGKPKIADRYDPKIWRWYLLSGVKPA